MSQTTTHISHIPSYNNENRFFNHAATTLAAATAFQQPISAPQTARVSTSLYEHITSGFTMASGASYKVKEKKKKDDLAKKNLGCMGAKGFQSCSFRSFQEALERGKAASIPKRDFQKR
ncbi:hypothetical protein ACHAXR_005556 [Thalassiosira sp. AJA248-18]